MNCHPDMGAQGARAAGSAWRELEDLAAQTAPAASLAWLGVALAQSGLAGKPWLARVDDINGKGPIALAGLRRSLRFAPLGRLATTRWGSFFFSGLPLLRKEREEEALHGLLWAAAGMGSIAAEFASVPVKGAFMDALTTLARDKGFALRRMAQWERAVLDARLSAQEWWEKDIPRKRRKEWSRLMRRLREAGQVEFESRASGDDLASWFEEFLTLEAQGWKGRAGTAVACVPSLRQYVAQVLRAHDASGHLRFWRLKLDGRVIAILFGTVHGDGLWLGKMAYAEDLGHYSPGVLLMIEATRDILADPQIAWADSCADPNHPMIDHLWKQRLELADVLVSVPGVSLWRVRVVFFLEALRLRLRGALKRLWKGWRRGSGQARKRAA